MAKALKCITFTCNLARKLNLDNTFCWHIASEFTYRNFYTCFLIYWEFLSEITERLLHIISLFTLRRFLRVGHTNWFCAVFILGMPIFGHIYTYVINLWPTIVCLLEFSPWVELLSTRNFYKQTKLRCPAVFETELTVHISDMVFVLFEYDNVSYHTE